MLCLLWKQVRTQQLHEMKKKEKEYIKLQVKQIIVCSFSSWKQCLIIQYENSDWKGWCLTSLYLIVKYEKLNWNDSVN